MPRPLIERFCSFTMGDLADQKSELRSCSTHRVFFLDAMFSGCEPELLHAAENARIHGPNFETFKLEP
jgi:hypothetical protein